MAAGVDWRARLEELEQREEYGSVGAVALAVLGPTLALTISECAGRLPFVLLPVFRTAPAGPMWLAFSQWALLPASVLLVVGPVWRGGRAERFALVPGLLVMALVAINLPATWGWPGLPAKPNHSLVGTLVPFLAPLGLVPLLGRKVGKLETAGLRTLVAASSAAVLIGVTASVGGVLPDLPSPTGRFLLTGLMLAIAGAAALADARLARG